MIIYFFIALGAALVGSAAGMGGGVIIKPLMDLAGDYSVNETVIFSSITVFSMAIFSTIKQFDHGFAVTRKITGITIGAVLGGVLGSLMFAGLKKFAHMEGITAIQSIILFLLLMICLVYERLPHRHLSSMAVQGLVGALLGIFSAFLGIGGGPINVAVMCVLFNFSLRESARVSVFIILFSQAAGLITKLFDGSFRGVTDYHILIFMIPAGIIGGILGAQLNHHLPSKGMMFIYKLTIILAMVVCAFNFIRSMGFAL